MHKKYDPFINFGGIDRIQEELGKIFNFEELMRDDVTSGATTGWRPPVDIFEDETHYLIHADLPGVDPESIDVDLKQGVLTLSGKRDSADLNVEGYKRRERRSGSFHRRFTLPETADAESIEATTSEGVLTIKIGKKSAELSRKIHVVKA